MITLFVLLILGSFLLPLIVLLIAVGAIKRIVEKTVGNIIGFVFGLPGKIIDSIINKFHKDE